MTRPSPLPALVAAALAAAVAAAWIDGRSYDADRPPARRELPRRQAWTSEDGSVTVRLPEHWVVEPRPPEGSAVMTLWAREPGARSRAAFHVHALTQVVNARGRLYFERTAALAAYGAERAEMHVGGDVPWFAVVDARRPEETRRRGYACRMLRGRAFLARFSTTPETAAAMESAFVDAVRDLETTLPEWPEPLPDHHRSIHHDLTFLLAPGADPADAEALGRFLALRESQFAARLGPVPKDPDAQVRVSLHPTRDDAARLVPGAGARGYLGWTDHRWLIATPLRGASPEELAHLDGDWEQMLWAQSFDAVPWWLHLAVHEVARWRTLAAAPLPAVPESLVPQVPSELVPFADVARMTPGQIQEAGLVHAVAYLVLFRAGPPLYSDAWEAFEREMRATGDPDAAQAHLFALEPERLRDDALRFARTGLRVVPGR